MVAEAIQTEQTWRLLWSHACQQVVSALPEAEFHEQVCAGYGWGVRCSDNRRRGLVVHPTADEREIGDLTITILGVGKHVVPRCGQDFLQYLATVRAAVQAATHMHL